MSQLILRNLTIFMGATFIYLIFLPLFLLFIPCPSGLILIGLLVSSLPHRPFLDILPGSSAPSTATMLPCPKPISPVSIVSSPPASASIHLDLNHSCWISSQHRSKGFNRGTPQVPYEFGEIEGFRFVARVCD